MTPTRPKRDSAGSPDTSPKTTRKASDEIRRRLARNLKLFREARWLTQEVLARTCRINKNYISNVERGTVNVTLASLEAFARGLGCTEAQLLARDPKPQR